MTKQISRSTVNEQQYSAQKFPTSGFPLSYTKYSSYMLGRLHISGVHDIVAGDKIGGKNEGNFTFNRIVTPFVSPVDAQQYNFYLPFRTLDRTFERAFAPNVRNNMSKDWSTPTVNTRYLVQKIFETYYGADTTSAVYQSMMVILVNMTDSTKIIGDLGDILYENVGGVVTVAVNSLRTGAFHDMAKKMYIDDALLDIADNIENKCGSLENSISPSTSVQDFAFNLLDCLLSPFIGRYSYYGELGYKYLRPNDILRIVQGVSTPTYGDWSTFLNIFDNTPLCEYHIRAMYVIWYEYFRNVNLEKETDDLPYWRDFGSTSIFDLDAGGNLCYLVYRIRPWYEDMFINAQVDDMSRHVYAPIVEASYDSVGYHVKSENNLDVNSNVEYAEPGSAGSRVASNYVLGWHDQLTGEDKQILCPVPANINDILSEADESFVNVYGLDLNTLRQSKQLEQYLKRNYLFGDEYKDRMLAHYNSRVSDMRVNRPELLSQSMNNSDMKQEVSNVSTDETKVGDRTATMTVTSGGDNYTTYCEEFGVVLNIITFMPRASYDGVHPQLLATKQVHYPLPEFATNNEEFGRKMEIADSAITPNLLGDGTTDSRYMFGRYMAYHAWRARVDEVGGVFLNEMQDTLFRRFWGLFSDDTTPKLNYYFLHCRPQLGMFANTNRYDTQLYGNVHHEFFVERVLPTPVEQI